MSPSEREAVILARAAADLVRITRLCGSRCLRMRAVSVIQPGEGACLAAKARRWPRHGRKYGRSTAKVVARGRTTLRFWAISVSRAALRMYVLLPAMLAVMSRKLPGFWIRRCGLRKSEAQQQVVRTNVASRRCYIENGMATRTRLRATASATTSAERSLRANGRVRERIQHSTSATHSLS